MGDELVKSEQSTLHLCDFCARRVRRIRQRGKVKSFFKFYCSLCSPSIFIQ
nr:MAG TPA: hypothetical protein [Caudoviricetes sp.]